MISVHAISILYELRALRSRLQQILRYQGLFADARTQESLEWSIALIEAIQKKVEHVDAYILQVLASEDELSAATAEADLGAHTEHRDRDHGGQWVDPPSSR